MEHDQVMPDELLSSSEAMFQKTLGPIYNPERSTPRGYFFKFDNYNCALG